MVNIAEERVGIRITDPERLPLGWSEYPNITSDRYASAVKTIPYGDVAALEDILDAVHIKKPTSVLTGTLPPQVYLETLTREYLEALRHTTGQKVKLGRRGRVRVVSDEQLRFRQMSDALVRARPIYNTLELDRHSKALSHYHKAHPRFRTPFVMSAHFLQEERGGRGLYSCIPASLRNILRAFKIPLNQIPREPEVIRRMLEGSEVTRKGFLHLVNSPGIAKTLDVAAQEQPSPSYSIGNLIERIVDRSVAMYEWAGHARALSGIVGTARGVFFVAHDPFDPQPQLLPLADVAQALPGWSYPDDPQRSFVFRQHSLKYS